MKIYWFIIAFLFITAATQAQTENYDLRKKVVLGWNDTLHLSFMHDSTLYTQGWDTLPQTVFWKEVISMTSDTCVINIAYCRKPVDRVNRMVWMNQTEPQKLCFKDSVCRAYGLDSATNLYVTAGKGEFYEVRKMMPVISKAITAFKKNNCDPWYAQAILLIESPGKTKSKSYVGANGPFQLMRTVAIKYGLRVNRKIDDRTDLEKSAKAASSLIKNACIPYIRKFLDEKCIGYNETDLWFRLLVLHAYHAGAGNVRCVINTINPTEGGVNLFNKLWQTTCGGFKNESQNYSQIALASLVNFDKLLHEDGDTVYLVRGDKKIRQYHRKNMKPWDAFEYLNDCMHSYERDFIDDVIPFDYFMKRIGGIRKEYTAIANAISPVQKDVILKKYPAGEEHLISLAEQLSRRQRYEDAIRLLKINLDIHPESVTSYDSLARLFRLTGDQKNAELYNSRAGSIVREPSKNTD
jgi:hypothetical protein